MIMWGKTKRPRFKANLVSLTWLISHLWTSNTMMRGIWRITHSTGQTLKRLAKSKTSPRRKTTQLWKWILLYTRWLMPTKTSTETSLTLSIKSWSSNRLGSTILLISEIWFTGLTSIIQTLSITLPPRLVTPCKSSSQNLLTNKDMIPVRHKWPSMDTITKMRSVWKVVSKLLKTNS